MASGHALAAPTTPAWSTTRRAATPGAGAGGRTWHCGPGRAGRVRAGRFLLGPLVLDDPQADRRNVLESRPAGVLPRTPARHGPQRQRHPLRHAVRRAGVALHDRGEPVGLSSAGLLGALSGYVGGAQDTVIMRVLDVLIAFPSLVLTLAVAQGSGRASTEHDPRAGVLQRPGLRPRVPGGHAGAPRAAVHGRGQAVRHGVVAGAVPGTWRRTSAPADHLRDARHGHRDHHRGGAELPRARRPDPRIRAGATWSPRAASLSATPIRRMAQPGPVRSPSLLQPPRRDLRARGSGR